MLFATVLLLAVSVQNVLVALIADDYRNVVNRYSAIFCVGLWIVVHGGMMATYQARDGRRAPQRSEGCTAACARAGVRVHHRGGDRGGQRGCSGRGGGLQGVRRQRALPLAAALNWETRRAARRRPRSRGRGARLRCATCARAPPPPPPPPPTCARVARAQFSSLNSTAEHGDGAEHAARTWLKGAMTVATGKSGSKFTRAVASAVVGTSRATSAMGSMRFGSEGGASERSRPGSRAGSRPAWR